MAITSADFDRVCTGDAVHIDYRSQMLPNLKEGDNRYFPRGIDQAALRQSYAYAWAQTVGSEYGYPGRQRQTAMYVLSSPSISVELARLSGAEASCIGYVPSDDGSSLSAVVSSRTETTMLTSTEVSSFRLSGDWRTMKYVQAQNAWCLLNNPGFQRFDGNGPGTRLNDTMRQVMDLHDQAKKDVMNTKSRFFLSMESKARLDGLDGKLLSSIQTSSELDLQTDELFKKLIAPRIQAADFGSYLSGVVSNGELIDPVFMNLSSVSSMYEPLAGLGGQTSYVMEPDRRLLDADLECACRWEETEKYSDLHEPSTTSADFIGYIAGTTGWYGFTPACPVSRYRYRRHTGYDQDGNRITLDRDRTGYGVCELSGYVESLNRGYDNRPALSAIDFMDNRWMRQRKTLGVRKQKLLVLTACVKRQTWSNEDQSENVSITADVYADIVDTREAVVRLSALVEDAVTPEDERCMLADVASTMPYGRRLELYGRIKDYGVDLPPDTALFRDDRWSRLDSPSPVWDVLVSHPPSLPPLRPNVELGWSRSEAWTGLVGCWAVTEVDSPLAGLLETGA